MNSFKKILKPYWRKLKKSIKFFRRVGLKNRDYTIISNNCTAGYVYQYFGLPYKTPTAGIFFESNDYLRLASSPKKYFMDEKLNFIKPDDSKNFDLYKDSYNWGNYPVARLGDIEVYFMHYPDKTAAEKMWYRRTGRINFNNIFFLFTENESFSKSSVLGFLKISTKNKICLTNNDYGIKDDSIIIDKRASIGGGNFSWTPKIILSVINWKTALNRMILK